MQFIRRNNKRSILEMLAVVFLGYYANTRKQAVKKSQDTAFLNHRFCITITIK